MTAAQLRLLRVFTLQFVTDAVKQLHVALLGILLERGDEGPRHGARCLAGDLRVLPTQLQTRISKCKHKGNEEEGGRKDLSNGGEGTTYEVWVSLLPLHMITSAGLVLVCFAFSYPCSPLVAFFKKPIAVLAIPPISPRAYALTMPSRPCPASLARFGSLSTPWVL